MLPTDSRPQVVNFHVSCSKRLVTEDQFGAIQLTAFVDSRGSSGDASCEERPAPPCELCCQLPPTLTTEASRRIVNKQACVDDALPAEILTDLQLWHDSNGGAVCTSNNIGGTVEWTASHTVERISQTLCNLAEDEDFCPEKIVTFMCCDPCDPLFACENTTASYEIGFESEAEITEQCTVDPPTPAPDGPCNVCVNRGRPMSLTFDITGGAPTGAGSLQGGKGGSTGGTIAAGGSYTASCTNGNAQLSGTTLVVGSFRDNDIFCTVSDGSQTQVINFHVSCSKQLITGDQHGAMQLTSFVDSGGRSSCSGSSWNPNMYNGNWQGNPYEPPAPQPERECHLCCIMPPVLEVPENIELPKIERCTEAGTLPAETKSALAVWLDSKRCRTMNHDSAVPIEMVRVNYVTIANLEEFSDGFSIDDLEQVICTAEGANSPFPECPIVDIEFSCCDPCAPDDTPFDGLDAGALCAVDSSRVSVVDTVPPVITASDKGVRCSLEPGENDRQFTNWVRSHTCSDAQSPGSAWNVQTDYVSRVSSTIDDDVCAIITEVEYNCVDECRNNAEPATVQFRIRDNVDPEVIDPPLDLVLECGDLNNQAAIDNWLDSDGGAAVADCNTVTCEPVAGDSDNSCPDRRPVDFVFSDPCGGTVTESATLIVEDTIPPIIQCLEEDGCSQVTEIECDGQAEYNVNLWLQANAHLTCTDSCSTTVSWSTPVRQSTAGEPPCVEVQIYMFTCTDACGNNATTTLPISVIDTVGPIIEQYPMNEVVECDGAGNVEEKQAFLTRWGTGGDTGIRWANDQCNPNPICNDAYAAARMMDQSGYANCGYCAQTEDLVCSGGTTYPNSCFAYCNGRHNYDNGACSDDVTTEAPAYTDAPPTDSACNYCSDEHTPVCVGGTLQFQNFCQAYCRNHWHFTVGACSHYGNNPETTQPPSCTESCGDYVSPVCGSNGENYISSCHAACDNVHNYQAGECPESCGEDPLQYGYTIDSEGNTPGCQAMVVTFNATDPCANTPVSHTAQFREEDTIPPDITTAAADTTVECDGDGNYIEFSDWVNQRGGAECNDGCSGDEIEWQINGIVGGYFIENGYNHVCGTDCPFDRCLTTSWTCTDSCGHVSETSAKFVIVDTTPPTLSVAPVQIDECGAGPNQATAWAMPPMDIALSSDDSCDYCAAGNPNPAQCDFSKQPVVTANLLGGSHRGPPYFWRQEDSFKLNLPVVPAGGVTGRSPSMVDAATRQHIIDNSNGLLEFDGESRCPLISTMELRAADACLNEGATTMAYHVHVDTTDPIWTALPQDQTVECDRSNSSNDDAFQAFLANHGNGACEDSCNFGPVSIGHVTPLADPVTGAPDSGNTCPNSRPVVFFCEDFCGNRIEHTVHFHIEDTQPPVVTSIADTTIECGPNVERRLENWAERQITEVEANDACTRSARLIAFAETGPLLEIDGTPSTCSDRYARTMFTVSDECDNAASDSARFFMIDSTAPDIIGDGVELRYTCDAQCTNRNEIARGLYIKWITQARGCLSAEDCQEDMTWMTENGPQDISALCGTSGSVDFVVTDGCGHSSRRSLDYDFGLTVPPPPPAPQQCTICSRQNKAQLRSLSFQWDSNSGQGTQVTAQGLGSYSAADGGIVTVTTSNRFSANMVIWIPGGGSRSVHVSCSVLLTVGQVVQFNTGTLTIIGFRTVSGRTEATCPGSSGGVGEPGFCEYPIDAVDVCDCVPQPAPPPGPLEDVCDSVSRPTQLTFTYRGGNSLTNRQLGKASVTGGVPTGTADSISCMGGSGRGGTVNAFTDVAIGEEVQLGNRWSGIGTELTCTVRSGSVTQVIEIHTSCSMALNTGDIFGSLQLSCFWNGQSQSCSRQSSGGSAGCALPPTPAPPSGGDCAACGGDRYAGNGGGGRRRPSVLTFRYITGFDVTNVQNGKVSVTPTTAAAGSATIQCTGGSAQSVPVGGEFTVGSAGSELGVETTCSVMSNTGTQIITFHTSCSAPLGIGDVFGSIVLISFARTDGAFSTESAACPARSAPDGASGNGGNENLSPPANDDGDDDHDDDFDDDLDDEVTADSCAFVNPCESIEENGGSLQSMTFQFVASNGERFVHSQGSFGAQQPYEVPDNGRATRVKVGGGVRDTWNLRDGDVFRVSASVSGVNKIPNQLSFLVGTGNSKARIRFQTNCRRELTIGDIFGVLKIVGFTTSSDSCETETISENIVAMAGSVSTTGSSLGASSIAGIVVGSMLVVVVVVGVFRVSTMRHEHATMLTLESSEPSTASSLNWDNTVQDNSKLGLRSNTKNMEEGSMNSGV